MTSYTPAVEPEAADTVGSHAYGLGWRLAELAMAGRHGEVDSIVKGLPGALTERPDFQMLLTRIALMAEDYDAALWYQRRLGEDGLEEGSLRSAVYWLAGQSEAACRSASEVLARVPGDLRAAAVLSEAIAAQGDLTAARTASRAAIAASQRSALRRRRDPSVVLFALGPNHLKLTPAGDVNELPGHVNVARVLQTATGRRVAVHVVDVGGEVCPDAGTVFNAIAEPDLHAAALDLLRPYDVLNRASRVLATRREAVAARLKDIPGLRVPKTLRISEPDAEQRRAILRRLVVEAHMTLPVFLRPTGAHTTQLRRIDNVRGHRYRRRDVRDWRALHDRARPFCRARRTLPEDTCRMDRR